MDSGINIQLYIRCKTKMTNPLIVHSAQYSNGVVVNEELWYQLSAYIDQLQDNTLIV